MRNGVWAAAWLALAAQASGADTNAMAAVAAGLDASLVELAGLRREIADGKIPLSRELSAAESQLSDARKRNEDARRQLDRRNLDVGAARGEIATREQEKSYVGSLLGEFARSFETRLHIAELARHQAVIEGARLAQENGNLKPAEVFAKQVAVLEAGLKRLEDLAGGDRFEGRAAGGDGLVKKGTFALLGPVAYFASEDGKLSGIAEQRLGSLEPAVQPYADPAYVPITRDFVARGGGPLPFDPSLGGARKIEETQEGVVEHFLKGGAVMWPILGVAILSAFVVLSKWLMFALTRMPAPKRLEAFLQAVRHKDKEAAVRAAQGLRGPAGEMLRAGAGYLDAPKDLIEEVMFEKMLDTKFRLNKALPLVAVCAACAPLLGLLGTVTGIIATFKLITVYGSGDVKMLSAGISEALITTEYGLYVAIPSILAHSFLSRRAKAIIDKMERLGIAFLTEIEKARSAGAAP